MSENQVIIGCMVFDYDKSCEQERYKTVANIKLINVGFESAEYLTGIGKNTEPVMVSFDIDDFGRTAWVIMSSFNSQESLIDLVVQFGEMIYIK